MPPITPAKDPAMAGSETQCATNTAATNDVVRLAVGIVSAAQAEHYTVVDGLARSARRAASCTCLPAVGDSVLLARSESMCWIVAVLVAAGERPLDLHATQVRIRADAMALDTNTLHTTSQTWQATHASLHLNAGETQACVGTAAWLGQKLTSWFDLSYVRNRRVLREVSEIESVNCGAYDLRVSETLLLSAQTSLITSQGQTKVDGAQVHVG